MFKYKNGNKIDIIGMTSGFKVTDKNQGIAVDNFGNSYIREVQQ
jgi:hypothetical protein